jgi:hypothetical protein
MPNDPSQHIAHLQNRAALQQQMLHMEAWCGVVWSVAWSAQSVSQLIHPHNRINRGTIHHYLSKINLS